MQLFDLHTHSLCSPDSNSPLQSMVQAALDAGLAGLCTTDHCDLIDGDGTPTPHFDWQPVLNQYETARAQYQGRLSLLLGLELGCAHLDVSCAEQIVSGAPLDFVLGSIHNYIPSQGGKDLAFLSYHSLSYCNTVLEDYLNSLLQLAPLACYDSLAHVVYPLRHMRRDGQAVSLLDYEAQLREIFTLAIHSGHALELNTNRGQDVALWRELISLFLDCGGEMVTLGSDAHVPKHVGMGISAACTLLQDCGLRYYTVFRQRKPQFIKL